MDKTLLLNLIEREQNYFDDQSPGDEEYVNSQKRLMNLKSQLTDLEKTETELKATEEKLEITKAELEISRGKLELSKEELEVTKNVSVKEEKDRLIRNILEGVKIGSGIVLPIIGLITITAVEKDITFTGSLREYTRYFLPKKNWKTDPKTRGYGNITSCFSHKKHIPL